MWKRSGKLKFLENVPGESICGIDKNWDAQYNEWEGEGVWNMEGMLEGFTVYKMVNGIVSITFTRNGLGFSKTAVEKLGAPEYVRVLFNREKKQMAIVACNVNDDGASRFARAGKDWVRWNSKDLSQKIRNITGWTLDRGERYTVSGEFHDADENAILLFDFTKAEMSHG